MKKKLTLVVTCIVLVAAMVIGGTLAYFTDTDKATNTFTVGNVDIKLVEVFDEKNAQLMPGVDVNKDVSIKNEGTNDAYVWYLWKIPADLDSIDGTTGTNNALHVNSLGSTWDKWKNDTRFWADGQTEALPDEKTWDHDPETELGLTAGPEGYLYTETIDEVEYHVYAVLYHGVLKAGEETTQAMTKVYLDTSVNQDKGGYYQIYTKGANIGQKHYLPSLPDNAQIIVEAYAIQADGLTDVNKDNKIDVYDAYLLYQAQK